MMMSLIVFPRCAYNPDAFVLDSGNFARSPPPTGDYLNSSFDINFNEFEFHWNFSVH